MARKDVSSELLLLISVAAAVAGQVLFKLGAARLSLSPAGVIAQFTNISLLFGFLSYFVSAVFYIIALQTVPLSIAYPTLAVGYIGVMVIAVPVFGESLSVAQVCGGALICLGVGLLWR